MKRQDGLVWALVGIAALGWGFWLYWEAKKRRDSQKHPNRLAGVSKLNNTFYVMRHGQSLANVEGIISSDPAIANTQHGLSDQGKTEAAKGAIELQRLLTEQNFEESKQVQVKIYCSPLLRAKETADIVVKNLDAHDLKPVVLWDLRERNFGSLNGKSDVHYADVWDEDLKDPDHHQFDVESPNQVLERTTQLILDLDNQSKNSAIVLIAHGDTLQILCTAFKGVPVTHHRISIEKLSTATVRRLELSSHSPRRLVLPKSAANPK